MVLYVHKLLANFVCPQFGAGKVLYCVFIRAFFLAENSCLLQMESPPMRAMRLNQNSAGLEKKQQNPKKQWAEIC